MIEGPPGIRRRPADALRAALRPLCPADPGDLLRVTVLIVAASVLAAQYGYLDRRDRGLWWGDGHYNLLRSYYILKGYKLYDEIVSGQFPGLQALYALVLWPLGYGRVRPSPETLAAIEAAGLFVNGAMQGVCYYLAFRVARVAGTLSLVCSLFLVYFLWEQHGHYYPLVETILVPTVALMVCLLARVFLGDPAERIRAALALWAVLAFAAVLGLTIAPAIALFGAVSAAAVVPMVTPAASRVRSLRDRVADLGGWRVFAPLILSGAFIGWTISSMGFRTAFYWTVVNPGEAMNLSVGRNLRLALTRLPAGLFHFSFHKVPGDAVYFPVWSLPQFVLLGLAVYFLLSRQRARGQALALAGFLSCVFAGYLLMGWRYPRVLFDFKKLPTLGISIGMWALILGLLTPASAIAGGRVLGILRTSRVVLALCWAVLALGCAGAAWPYRAPAFTSPRNPVFDEAGVCRLGQSGTDCSCLLQASYDPRRFLEFDVQPCLGYSPEQPFMIQRSRRSREQFEAAVDDPHIAFFMGGTKESVTIWEISEQTYDRIIASRTCLPLYRMFRVCYPSERNPGAPPRTR